VDIQTTAYPDKVFTGKITRLSNIFDAEERVLKAIIEIDNQDLRLKPSMMVSVTVYNPSEQQAMRIPKAGVIFSDNNSYVLVYKNDCDVKAVQIKPVGSDSKFYYVNSDDNIQLNDRIITQNQLLIYTKLKEM
jgi:cobalt-zinc-cadmium efflux system membrane fusion protein